MIRPSRGLFVVVACAAIAGCGVRLQDEPQGLDPREVPYGLLDDRAGNGGETDAPTSFVTFFFRDDRLIAVPRIVTTSATPEVVVDSLLRGTSVQEELAGLTSAIPDGTTLLSIAQQGGVVRIELGGAIRDASDLAAAYRQLDASLRELADVDEIRLFVGDSEVEGPAESR